MNLQQIGPYRVIRQVGEGGMGRVFEAVHTQIERRAAIKILHPQLAGSDDLAARFVNEARSVNRIRHPGIVEIIDYGQLEGGTPYLVMEFLEGESLFQRLQRNPKGLGLRESLHIARQIALAAAAAHDKGIVHRDLKPENIMLVPDPAAPGGERVKILDFGIAKLLSDQRALATETLPGVTMGTPEYMAPEQHSSAAWVTDRADVFSLGAMLYEMLSGQRPFRGPKGALAGDPPPLRQLALPIPEEVALLVERMMSRDPAARPVMAGVAAMLDEQLPGGRRRSLVLLGAALCALTAVLVIGGALLYRRLAAPATADLTALRRRALEVLQADLRAPDRALRVGALAALGGTRDVRLRPLVEPLLADGDAMVQAQAAEALGQLGDRGAVAPLLSLLRKSPGADVTLAVAAALDQLGDARGRELLSRILGQKVDKGEGARNEAARLRAALILCGKRDADAQQYLSALLQRGGVPDDLALTIQLRLAQAGDAAAREALVSRLAEAAGELRLSVAASLARLGDDQGRAALLDAARRPGGPQLLAARLLAALGEEEGLPLLRSALPNKKYPAPARILAAEGLGDGGGPQDAALLAPLVAAAPPGAPALDGEPPALRQAAARALLQLAASDPQALSEQSLAWARVALGDESAAVRESAVAALGEEPGQVAMLAEVLQKDEEALVRRSAARTLGQSQMAADPAALQALAPALEDRDAGVRQEALRALGRIGQALRQRGDSKGQKEVERRLSGVAASGAPSEQVVARAALLRLGDESQRGALRGGLDSPDPEVRRLVVEQADLDGEVLLRALSDKSLGVRWAAARKLAEQGDKRAAPSLRAALLLGGVEGLEAYGLLHRLGYAAKPPPDLADLLIAPSVQARLSAVEAMGHLPPRQAVSLLWRAAYDPESAVRRMVTEVAAELPAGPKGPLGAPVLRLLRTDPDAAVRARANLLLLRYRSTAGARPELTGTPALPALNDPPPLPPGAIAAEVDRLVREGIAAFRRKDFAAARRLLEEAHAMCVKGLSDCGAMGYDLRYLLDRVYAESPPEAGGKGARAPGAPGAPGGPKAAEPERERERGKAAPQGRVRISRMVGQACKTEEKSLPEGKQIIDLGRGRTIPVQVRAGETLTVDACER